jgi:perosamine synthetase
VKKIPAYEPWLTGLEKSYAKQAIDSTWISSNGEFIAKAEGLFAKFIGAPHAIVANNGTNAMHLCCRAARMKPGDVVIVPACTYAATAFAALYCGAKLKFVDSDPDTWNMSLEAIEHACQKGHVDFVIAVHLFGNPVDMEGLNSLAEEYNFVVIEDACESIGASINGIFTGNFSKIAAFSFYGNKTFTSGEGGAVVSRDKDLVRYAEMLRGQGQSFDRRYWHIDVGYNYRMTNIQAAILCAQIERGEEILTEKWRVANRYLLHFSKDAKIETQRVLEGHRHGYWMNVIKTPLLAEYLAQELGKNGIDTRPMFYPLSEMPPFRSMDNVTVSKSLSERCLMLPSSPSLSNDEIDYICNTVVEVINASAKANHSRSI